MSLRKAKPAPVCWIRSSLIIKLQTTPQCVSFFQELVVFPPNLSLSLTLNRNLLSLLSKVRPTVTGNYTGTRVNYLWSYHVFISTRKRVKPREKIQFPHSTRKEIFPLNAFLTISIFKIEYRFLECVISAPYASHFFY